MTTFFLPDREATLGLGQRLGKSLSDPALILLRGELGAGKTEFVRGLCMGLNCPEPVSSPTFTLMHLYEGGRMTVCHIDAYRVCSAEEAEAAGLFEYIGACVVAIEWPDALLPALPEARVEVSLSYEGEGRRACVSPDIFAAKGAEG